MKTLDRSRAFATVSGQAEHRYEQDDLRFDAGGKCMDDAAYKKAQAPAPVHDTRTTAAQDPAILEQITAQTGGEPGSLTIGAPTTPTTPVGASGDVAQDQTTELETLGLSGKVESALRGAEINTVEQLCACTEEQLANLPNIGAAAVKAIKAALKDAKKKLAKK